MDGGSSYPTQHYGLTVLQSLALFKAETREFSVFSDLMFSALPHVKERQPNKSTIFNINARKQYPKEEIERAKNLVQSRWLQSSRFRCMVLE